MKKIIAAILVICTAIGYIPAVHAAEGERFLTSPYAYFTEGFASDRLPEELTGFSLDNEDECAIVKANAAFNLQNALGGKSEVSFQFMPIHLEKEGTINVYGDDLKNNTAAEVILQIKLRPIGENRINIMCGYTEITTVLTGENLIFTLCFSNNTCRIIIKNAISQSANCIMSIPKNTFFKGLCFNVGDNCLLDDLCVRRENIYNSGSPVLYESNGIVTGGAYASNQSTDEKQFTILIAQYSTKGDLLGVNARTAETLSSDSMVLELSAPKNNTATDIRCYLFSEMIKPQGKAARTVSEEGHFFINYTESSVTTAINQPVRLDNKIENTSDMPVKIKVTSASHTVFEKDVTYSDYQSNGVTFTPDTEGVYTVETFVYSESYIVKVYGQTLWACTQRTDDTYVFCSGKSEYIKNGTTCVLKDDRKLYIAEFDGNGVYLPATFYDACGIRLTFSDGIACAERGGEAINLADGSVRETVSSVLYDATAVFGTFGYYIFVNGGLAVISRDDVWEHRTPSSLTDYYSEVFFSENFDAPSVSATGALSASTVTAFDWGNQTTNFHYGITDEDAADGRYSYYLGYSDKSFRGFYHKLKAEYDDSCMGYRITFKAKASADSEGNLVGVSAIFYTENEYKYQSYFSIKPSKENFETYSVLVPKERFPYEEYESVCFICATSAVSNSETYSGKIYFDDVKIEKFLDVEDTKIELCEQYSKQLKYSLTNNDMEIKKGWGSHYWGSGAAPENGFTTEEHYSGKQCIYLDVPTSSFAGCLSSSYNVSKRNSFKVEAAVLINDDFTDASVSFRALLYNKGNFMRMVNGSPFQLPQKGIWTVCESTFASLNLSSYEYDSMIFVLCISSTGSNSRGRVYFDDVHITDNAFISKAIHADITADTFASWYVLGNDVTYKFHENSLNDIQRLTGTIYNSSGEQVDEVSVSTYTAYSRGWQYTPTEPGYYEVAFSGTTVNGVKVPIVRSYQGYYTKYVQEFELSRCSFAVVPAETKPMNERNHRQFLSESGKNTDALALGNLIGFYGVRLHTVNWGSTVTEKGIEPEKGVYDWTVADTQVQNVKNAGYQGMTINLFATPLWAVPADVRTLNGYTVVGAYHYNCYAPENMNDLASFCKAIAERYKDDTLIWEFWNEPQMGSTAFWQDKPENFAAMMKTAYSAIKSVDADAVVSLGGMGGNNSYYTFFNQMMDDADLYNSFDMVAIHGAWNDYERFKNIFQSKGYTSKPYWNSEGYLQAYYDSGVPADSTAQAMYFVMNQMQHFKQGSELITHFSVSDFRPDEYRVFLEQLNSSAHSMGLFRAYPDYEPKLCAVTAHTLLELMQDDFAYESEYVFNGNCRAVRFTNGGAPMLVLWNSAEEDFELPSELSPCIKNARIIDMEGRNVTNTHLKKNNIYFITNVNEASLNAIATTADAALNGDYEKPYYTCEIRDEVAAESTGDMSNVRLFDTETFTTVNDIAMIKNGWSYRSNLEIARPSEFDASFAVSADADGLYVLVDVTDSVFATGGSSGGDLTTADSVEFAIDTSGEGNAKDRIEFVAASTDTGEVLYKRISADAGASLPVGCSPSDTYLDKSLVNITRSSNHTIYKIYIPSAELYPYAYPGIENNIRFALAVNNGNGSGNIGYLEWGSGLANSSAEPSKYGQLTFKN